MALPDRSPGTGLDVLDRPASATPTESAGSTLRDLLANSLFPLPPANLYRRRTITLMYVAGFSISCGYLLLIPAGWTRLDHVWAEDGARFLGDAETQPFGSALIQPWGGYLHSIPRLFAELVAFLPLSDAAMGLALSAAVLRAGLAVFVFAASGGILRSTTVRLGLAAMVVVHPVANSEALNNLTNFHWFALYGAFWALLWRPSSRWQNLLATGLLFLAVTTTPLALLLLPLAIARLVLCDKLHRLAAIGFCTGALIQLVAMATTTRAPYSSDSINIESAVLAGLVRVPLVAFVGSEDAAELYLRYDRVIVLAALVVALAFVGIAVFWGGASRRFLAITAMAYSGLFIAIELSMNWTSLLPADHPQVNAVGQRYSVAPCLFLLAGIAAGLDLISRRRSRHGTVIVARIAVAMILLAGIVSNVGQSHGRLEGVSWRQAVAAAADQCADGGGTGVISHQPEGQPEDWSVRLPCEEIRRG